jgi:hypothetical protein
MLKMRLELLGDFEELASLLRSVGRPVRSRVSAIDRDEECVLFVERDDVAHYSTFIAGIGQVRDYTVCLIGMG